MYVVFVAVEEASEAYKLWVEEKEKKSALENKKKPAPYKHVKVRLLIHSFRLFL